MTVSTDPPISPPQTPRSPAALHSVSAFARFEFEAGKGNEGTKILMVEWEDDDASRNTAGAWSVSWSGKSTQLPADDRPADNLRRLYFLLGPGQSIPWTITLSYDPTPDSAATGNKAQKLTMTPLPAIFPPELGATARQSGMKGVLHTLWAKQRLRVLDGEIEHEEEFNLEGIALEIALAEREWIQRNFGVSGQHRSISSGRTGSSGFLTPTTPRSPGGSRLTERLKSLGLGTGEKDLKPRADVPFKNQDLQVKSQDWNPLSPEPQDIVVSSFGSFHETTAPDAPSTVTNGAAIEKKEEHSDVQNPAQMILPFNFLTRQKSADSGEELFAKALSPRTPEIEKGLFS